MSTAYSVNQNGRKERKNQRTREDATATFAKSKGESITAVGGVINVLKDYRWTLSKHKDREDVPYIWLKEFNSNESQVQKQLQYYSQLLPSRFGAAAGTASLAEPLDIYREIYPHSDTENCYQYILPYFNKTNLDLSTPNWSPIEPAGAALQSAATQFAGWAGGKVFGEAAEKVAGGISSTLDAITTAGTIAAQAQYPVVGALDRPRIFSQHSERTITVSFPLFNTVDPNEWKANQKLVHTLMNQNLMYKTNYVTGVPPVFYDVFIPGQYYCWASCVTNLNVENLGNMRVIDSTIVPDAYQVTVSFTEMVLPSKNQFDARFTGEASFGKVNVSVTGASTEALGEMFKKVSEYFNPEVSQNFNRLPGG